MKDINSLLVHGRMTVRESLKCLDQTGQGILLLVDDAGQLLRTVTDGDLRRLILRGVGLDEPISSLESNHPVTASPDMTNAQLVELMHQHGVTQVPIVDHEGTPLFLSRLQDIEAPILLSTPHMGEMELEFVNQAFDTNWIAPLGPNVDAFEAELADKVGIGHAAALSSGTAAIHLALVLLDVGPGDTVFCPSLTFVASANPILYQGATPVFIDSDLETWNMSPAALDLAMKDADQNGTLPKAVIVVDLYGQSADLDPLLEICGRYDIPVIEDAAESLGATYKGKASGTLGTIGVYSFNGNKIITTSGGGMLVSENADFVERAKHLATQAKEQADWYEHKEVGYNYRMSNILAGIGRGQLKVLEDRVLARRRVFERYEEGLSDIPRIHWMPDPDYGVGTRWLTTCILDPGVTRIDPAGLMKALAAENVEIRRTWKPMHKQALFKSARFYCVDKDEPWSEYVFEHGVCLPSGSNLDQDQQDRVIDLIRKSLND